MAITTRLDGKRSFKKPFGELRDGQPRPLYDRIYIDPEQNVIIGSRNIARYLGVTSLNTIWSWTELYGLPIIKRPDGLWMTTMTAIDQWIFIAASIIEEQREKGIILSKGSIRTAAKRAAQGTGAIPLSKAHQNTSNRMAPIASPGMYERDRLRSEAEQTALLQQSTQRSEAEETYLKQHLEQSEAEERACMDAAETALINHANNELANALNEAEEQTDGAV